MHINRTILLVIMLLISCWSHASTDGDQGAKSADLALETSVKTDDAHAQLKYSTGIRSIFEDSKGRVWIGNNGLGVLLSDGKTITNFTEQHGLSIKEKGPSGSLGRIFSIAEDAAGNIWFGTRDNGVWRFDGESLTNFTLENGLTSRMVWTMYRDKRDVLWFGMGDGSVCQFNGESFDKMY